MNILVIAHYQDDGSPYVSFVHSQVMEYVRQGHHVIVVVPTTFGKRYKHLRGRKHVICDEVPIYYIDSFSFSNYGKYNLNNFFCFAAVDAFIKKILFKHSIDMIHAHTIIFDGYIAVKIKEKYHIPVVITSHGSEVDCGKEDYYINICKKADCIVAVSTKLKKILMDLCPSLRISVIMNGFHQLSVPIDSKKPYTVIQVGSLLENKKTDLTILAFAKILEKYPQARLEIIGEGIEEERLKKLCKDLNIENFVSFCGYLKNNEVLKHMAASTVFIMPSVDEGFGIVYIEAMSQKCVTIGTSGEGIGDIIEDGVNGFLIQPDNLDDIVRIISKCFESPEYCCEIANNGFLSVQDCTWENNAKKYIQIFEKIISKNS